jgi:hypothetical protein
LADPSVVSLAVAEREVALILRAGEERREERREKWKRRMGGDVVAWIKAKLSRKE